MDPEVFRADIEIPLKFYVVVVILLLSTLTKFVWENENEKLNEDQFEKYIHDILQDPDYQKSKKS